VMIMMRDKKNNPKFMSNDTTSIHSEHHAHARHKVLLLTRWRSAAVVRAIIKEKEGSLYQAGPHLDGRKGKVHKVPACDHGYRIDAKMLPRKVQSRYTSHDDNTTLPHALLSESKIETQAIRGS